MHQEQEDDIEMDVADSEDEEIDEEDDMHDDDDPPEDDELPPPAEEEVAVQRRRAIQQIMRDTTISDQEKRMRIQNLMSNNRISVAPPPAPVLPAAEANAACVHYERNCNIVAPCCQRVFGCRICHDELSDPDHPPMNRFLIQQVVCKNCNTQQPVSNQCINCQTVFGEYYCGVCNLWMSMVSFFIWSFVLYLVFIGSSGEGRQFWFCSDGLLSQPPVHSLVVRASPAMTGQETFSLRTVRILSRWGRRIFSAL